MFCCLSQTDHDLPSMQLHQSMTCFRSTPEFTHHPIGNRGFYREVKRPEHEAIRAFFSPRSRVCGFFIHTQYGRKSSFKLKYLIGESMNMSRTSGDCCHLLNHESNNALCE